VDDQLTAEAVEVERRGRRGIYDVKIINQKGETVALFRGHSATVKGTWV
jgi:acyl-CoA thioesterase